MNSFFENIKKIISIDSTVPQGTAAVADFIAELATEFQLEHSFQEGFYNGVLQKNVIVSTNSEDGHHNLLLVSHLDTVEPGAYSLWDKTEFNPFNASITKEQVFGLGSASSKVDFLCKLYALKKLKDEGEKPKATLLGSFGREHGMSGVKKFLQSQKIDFSCALVSEPTSNQLVHSSIGMVNIEITIPFAKSEISLLNSKLSSENFETQSRMFKGKLAQPNNPDWDDNAIDKLITYLGQLPSGVLFVDLEGGTHFNTVPENAFVELELDGQLRETAIEKLILITNKVRNLQNLFKTIECDGFSPPHSTINVGKIKKYDDHIRLYGSCKITPNISEEIYSGWINEMKTTCVENQSVFRIIEYKPAYQINIDDSVFSEITKSYLKVYDQLSTGLTSICTEANVLNRRGVPTLLYGPGRGVGNVFEPNESINIEDTAKAQNFYENVLRGYC